MKTLSFKARIYSIVSVNAFLFLSSLIIVIIGIAKGAGAGQVGAEMYGLGYLKAFTVLSNILSGLGASVIFVFAINSIFCHNMNFPRWAVIFQYICACAVGLTFVTVAVFLAPMCALKGDSYFKFFSNDMFFFHFFNPLLAGLSVVFLLNDHIFSLKHQLLAMIPTVIYSILYFFCVVVFKTWTDFYNFTFGGKYYMIPVSLLMMYGFTWLISLLYKKLHNLNVGK